MSKKVGRKEEEIRELVKEKASLRKKSERALAANKKVKRELKEKCQEGKKLAGENEELKRVVEDLTKKRCALEKDIKEVLLEYKTMESELRSAQECCEQYWKNIEQQNETIKVTKLNSEDFLARTYKKKLILNICNNNEITVKMLYIIQHLTKSIQQKIFFAIRKY